MKYSSEHFEITKRFWDGTKKDKDTGKVTQFKFNQSGMEAAIARATRDLMARTLTPTGEKEKFSETIVKPLREKLEEWFVPRDQITEEIFDKWHAETCGAVLGILRKHYYNDKDRNPVQYGKAQKIVNMTMKELYCLPGSEKYEKHFDYCHIPLDSFTLEWFFRNILLPRKEANSAIKTRIDIWKNPIDFEEYLSRKESRELSSKEEIWDKYLSISTINWGDILQDLIQWKDEYEQQCVLIGEGKAKRTWCQKLSNIKPQWIIKDVLHKSLVVSWSVMPEASAEKAYGYHQYATWIRNYFDTDHPYKTDTGEKLTPFQAEFYIWSEIQLEMAAEVFYGQDIGKAEVIEEANINEDWKNKWRADKVDEKDFDDQFKWCKERFKEEPLDKKIEYLNKRVEKLNILFGNAVAPADSRIPAYALKERL